jgi:molybdate transport system substrate-binding protein
MKTSAYALAAVLLIAAPFASLDNASHAADIEVLSLVSLKPSLEAIAPKFEQATGHKVHAKFGTSTDLIKRFAGGETFDVALGSSQLIDSLQKDGKIVAGSRADMARVAIGVGVRKGAPKPDISTTDAFRRTLLNVSSVSHASDGPSGVYLRNLLKKLGIADEMQPKLRPVPGGSLVVGPVSRGEVELAVITIPFIVLDPGAELVGPLPDELQQYVIYAAGLSSNARSADAAAALIKELTSSESASVFKSQGLSPVSR